MYLLDTNICVFAIKHHAGVVSRLKSLSPDDVLVSSISIAEIWYGIAKSRYQAKNLQTWQNFLEPLKIIDFGETAAKQYGFIRSQLEGAGKMIGNHDCMIAAIALVNDCTVITNNTKEFHRVEGLQVVDWTN